MNRLLEVACSIVLQTPITQTIAAHVSPTPAVEILDNSFQFSRQELTEFCREAWWRSFATLSSSLEPELFKLLDERIAMALNQVLIETTLSSFQEQEGFDPRTMQAFMQSSAALCRSLMLEDQTVFSANRIDKLNVQALVTPLVPLQQGEVGRMLQALLSTTPQECPSSFLALLNHQLLLENLFLYFFVQQMQKEARTHQTLTSLREIGYWFTLQNLDIAGEQLTQGMKRYSQELQRHEEERQKELAVFSRDGHFVQAQTLLSDLSSLHKTKSLCAKLSEENESVLVEAQMAWQVLGGTFDRFTDRFGDLCEALHIAISSPTDLYERIPKAQEESSEEKPSEKEPISPVLAPMDSSSSPTACSSHTDSYQEACSSHTEIYTLVEKHVEKLLTEKIDSLLTQHITAVIEKRVEQIITQRLPFVVKASSESLPLPAEETSTLLTDIQKTQSTEKTQENKDIEEWVDISAERTTEDLDLQSTPTTSHSSYTIGELCRRIVLSHRLLIRPLDTNTMQTLLPSSLLSQRGIEALKALDKLKLHGRTRVNKAEKELLDATGLILQILNPNGEPAESNQSLKSVKLPGHKWGFIAKDTLYLRLKPPTQKHTEPSWRKQKSISYGKHNAAYFMDFGNTIIQLHTPRGLCEAYVDSKNNRITGLKSLFNIFSDLQGGDVLCLSKDPAETNSYFLEFIYQDLHATSESTQDHTVAFDNSQALSTSSNETFSLPLLQTSE